MTAKSKPAKLVAARKPLPNGRSRNAQKQPETKAERRPEISTANPPTAITAMRVVRDGTKSAKLLALLRAKHGATIAEMMKATGWQAHSVRGFLAGAARKRHGLSVTSERPEGEERRYRGG